MLFYIMYKQSVRRTKLQRPLAAALDPRIRVTAGDTIRSKRCCEQFTHMLAKSKTLFHNHALSLICGTLHSSKLISVPSVHRRSYVISKNIIEQRRRSKKKTQKMAKLQSNGDGPVTLRHVRVRQKGGDAMPAPSFVELQVVGNGRGGTPRSLYINTDHSK